MAVNRFLALDIGASSLKVGEFVSNGPGDLALVNFGYAKLPVDPTTDEDILPALSTTFHRLMVERQFKARKITISVSGQLVLTRFLKLPAADEAKIRQMVKYEAAQNVPFPIEEVVWDYQIIGTKTGSELEVAMVAIKSEIIEGFNRTMETLGLRVEVVDISPLSIYNSLLYNYEMSPDGSILLVDIGARTTNLIFVEPKKIFTRSIPIAGNTVTQNVMQEFEIPFQQAEDLKLQQGFVGLGGAYEEPELESAAKLCKIIRNVMTRLHAEIARSITFYKTQQHGRAPKRFLLSGGTSVTSYMDYFFKEKMEMEIEYFNPFKNVHIKVQPEELEKVVHLMSEVVGLGLRVVTECPIEINLIPPTVHKRRQLMKKVPFFGVSLLGILMIVLSWWLYYWKVTDENTKYLQKVGEEVSDLTQQNNELKKAIGVSERISQQAEQADKVIRARYFWIQFFQKLNEVVPPDLWITEFVPCRDKNPISILDDTKLRETMRENAKKGIGVHGNNQKGGNNTGTTSLDFITGFQIRGSYLIDLKENTSDPYGPYTEFQKALADNFEYFQPINSSDLTLDTPEEGDWTATFKVFVKLKEPIPY